MLGGRAEVGGGGSRMKRTGQGQVRSHESEEQSVTAMGRERGLRVGMRGRAKRSHLMVEEGPQRPGEICGRHDEQLAIVERAAASPVGELASKV